MLLKTHSNSSDPPISLELSLVYTKFCLVYTLSRIKKYVLTWYSLIKNNFISIPLSELFGRIRSELFEFGVTFKIWSELFEFGVTFKIWSELLEFGLRFGIRSALVGHHSSQPQQQ